MRDAQKKIDIWKYPRFLIIHLKRFEYTIYGMRVKIQTKVDFPLKDMKLSSMSGVSLLRLRKNILDVHKKINAWNSKVKCTYRSSLTKF